MVPSCDSVFRVISSTFVLINVLILMILSSSFWAFFLFIAWTRVGLASRARFWSRTWIFRWWSACLTLTVRALTAWTLVGVWIWSRVRWWAWSWSFRFFKFGTSIRSLLNCWLWNLGCNWTKIRQRNQSSWLYCFWLRKWSLQSLTLFRVLLSRCFVIVFKILYSCVNFFLRFLLLNFFLSLFLLDLQ